MMMFEKPMEQSKDENGADARLEQLFRAYREAMPDPEAGANFMPGIWARIEERERSSNWFGRVAKGLVTAAVAAYLILAMISPSAPKQTSYYSGTFVEALVADHMSSLDSLHLDRISQLEMERQ
jgi:hypothetical protein